MTTTTSETVIREWADAVNSGEALSAALDLNPCETLHMLFPAIVGDDEVMGALSALLDPVMGVFASLEVSGAIPPMAGYEVTHDVFHLLQIAAGLGHMLGTADALAMAADIPGDLSEIAWDNVPTLEDLTSPVDDEGAGSEES